MQKRYNYWRKYEGENNDKLKQKNRENDIHLKYLKKNTKMNEEKINK